MTSSRASRAASVTPASSRVLEPAAPGEYPAARGRFASSFGVSALALAALVAVAVGARFAASLGLDTPWFAPDEMAYALLGRSFWLTGHSQYLAGSTTFLGAYSFLAGAPLAAFGPGTGLVVLKGIQALLVAVPVVAVYLWARGIVRDGWALAAAAMTAALPAFAYSGLIMTEVVFLAVVTLLLWQVWRMLLDPSLRNQILVLVGIGVAVAIRLKAMILLPAIVIAILLMAWFARERRFLRRFAALAIVLGGGFVLAAGVALAARPGLLGPYALAVDRGYDPSAVLHWIAYTAGDLLLLVVVIPVFAALVLAVLAFQGRGDRPTQALVALTLPYAVLLVLEMGAYVSRFDLRLIERSLITLAPPLFIALATWIDRGVPRGRLPVLIATVLLLPAFVWPTGKVINGASVTDSFTTIPLFDLRFHTSVLTVQLTWTAIVAVALFLAILLPRRLAVVLVVTVTGCLLTASVLAQTKLAGRSSSDRQTFFGTGSPSWIDRAATGPVVYLDEDPLWAGSWHLAYWNPKIELVSAVVPPTGQRPDAATSSPQSDGRLVDASGNPLTQRLVLAPSTMTLVGRRLAHRDQGGDEPGLDLWATPGPPTVLTWTHGVLPQPLRVDVYRCTGVLELSVAARSGRPDVFISAGGLPPAILPLPPGRRLRLRVPAPPGGGQCSYTIRTDGDLSLTAVAFEGGAAPAQAGAVTAVQRLASTAIPGSTPSPGERPKLAYCIDGNFQMLPAGAHGGAKQASFVQGTGLTCVVPPGYVHQGYATEDVPPGIYPLYVPPAG